MCLRRGFSYQVLFVKMAQYSVAKVLYAQFSVKKQLFVASSFIHHFDEKKIYFVDFYKKRKHLSKVDV